MKFRFNVTDRVGMVWILMILVSCVVMMRARTVMILVKLDL
jgi:hypothetical protein